MDVTDLMEKVEVAKGLATATERRVALRAIYAEQIGRRLAAIEEHLSIRHEGLEELDQALGELNRSFTDES